MIDKTIHDIESKILSSTSLTTAQRSDLQTLVNDLKKEVGQLSVTNRQDAESIAAFAAVATGEGLRDQRDPQLLRIAVSGIQASVAKFESTHPALTFSVNSFCTFLANIGI